MRDSIRTRGGNILFSLALLLLCVVMPSLAFGPKQPQGRLDKLMYVRPDLRVRQVNTDSRFLRDQLDNILQIDAFIANQGQGWRVWIDENSGRPSLVDGGAIPMIPGAANSLPWGAFSTNCQNISCLPLDKIEVAARDFLKRYSGMFRINPDLLVLDQAGSGPRGGYIYLLRFYPVIEKIPIINASVYFRINNGNLIQVSMEGIGDLNFDPTPTLPLSDAKNVFMNYVGPTAPNGLTMLEDGTLTVLPVIKRQRSSTSGFGDNLRYTSAYRFLFRDHAEMGTWEVLIDAKSGELLSFLDINRYGKITGGIYPVSLYDTQVSRQMPYADYSPGLYTDAAGNYTYPGGTVTSELNGRYVRVNDSCGVISLSSSASPGDIDFLVGTVPSDDSNVGCVTPLPAGYGGPGNTHASRSSYYHLNLIKEKGRAYLPANGWLQAQLNDNVNLPQLCNAYWDGWAVNFFRFGGGCADTGELAGVFLHEWGHGLDDNDGSGGGSAPVETYADWTAILQTHDSCAGTGFFLGANCGGYGDSCTNCDGIRDADWARHSSSTPWTPSNYGTFWGGCGSGYYFGPCGWEDHCEAGIATQALWDMAARDLVSAPTGMDQISAWQLMDRLWYLGIGSLGAEMYSCPTPATANGCGGSSLYSVMRAIDDDGDGTSNGTPHAAAIYAALARHGIACGNSTDPENQNQTSCPSLSAPLLSGTAGNNSATLNWGAVTGAVQYDIFRNEFGCDMGFTKVGSVSDPLTNYVDSPLSNGLSYFYRVQAVGANPSCTSPMSNCATVVPQPYAGTIIFDRSSYGCSSVITITVTDADLVGAGTQNITIWSGIETTPETVTLAETPPGSGIMIGSMNTTAAPPANGDGLISVVGGDTVTARYIDADDHQGNYDVPREVSAQIDCQGPVISNVQVTNIFSSNATITWTTSEPADSTVHYGTACGSLTQSVSDAQFMTGHSINITGLNPLTLYYFSVTSADAESNPTTDDNGGACYSFSTVAFSPFVYVANEESAAEVRQFTPDGLLVDIFAPASSYLYGTAFLPNGNLLACDFYGGVFEYDQAGNLVKVFASGDGYPVDVAVSRSGNVYISKYYGGTVEIYDWQGTYQGSLGTFGYPYGIAIDSNLNIYVSQDTPASIKKFSPTGEDLGTIADALSGINYPRGMMLLPDGTLLVANQGTNQLLHYTTTGDFLGTYGNSTNAPFGMALDSYGRVLVANIGGANVTMYDQAGNYLGVFADGSSGLTYPASVAVAGMLNNFYAGTIAMDKALYGCFSTVIVKVSDLDLKGLGSATAWIWSTTEGTPESLLLTENPVNTGLFTGTIYTSTVPASTGDGLLSVSNGDTIMAQYIDADDHLGNFNIPRLATSTVDCQPPIISGVIVTNVTATTATIAWSTDKSANSLVTYGTTPPPGNSLSDLTHYVTSHSMSISGLSPCTVYILSVASSDISGNQATDNNGGVYYTFTTNGIGYALGPEDVESGPGSWITSGGGDSLWHVDLCRASSGSYSWKAGSASCPGTYNDSVDTYLTSPIFSLGAPGHGGHLIFREWYQTEGCCDYMYSQISTDGGANWSTIAGYSGSSDWQTKDYDLSAYSGSNVRIRFWFHTDSSVVYEGWYVDDIEVNRNAVCGPHPVYASHAIQDSLCGNGDGVVDPGERITFPVTLLNDGMDEASAISANLSTTTPGITVNIVNASFPDLSSGISGQSITPHFEFTVGSSVPCGTQIEFELSVSCLDPLGQTATATSSFTVRVGSGSTQPANVAIFQNNDPWGFTSNQTILAAHGIPYTILSSSDIGVADLSPYDKVIISSQQSYSFYETLANNTSWFESWINAGGNFEMHGSTYFSDDWGALIMPGGWSYQLGGTELVGIANPAHPLVTTPNLITDSELDSWNYSSHGYIDLSPPSAETIIIDEGSNPGRPITQVWRFGNGWVVVTLQTLEFAYGYYGYCPILENFLMYMPAGSICHPRSAEITGPHPPCGYGTLSTQNFSSYQWYRNGSIISGATNRSYFAPTSGSYTVRVKDCGGQYLTSPAFVIYPIPSPAISGPSSGCGFVTLLTGTFDSYQWYLDGAEIPGAILQSFDAIQSGNYTVRVVSSNSCPGISAAKAVVVHPIPSPVVSGDWSGCSNPGIPITTAPFAAYQWRFYGSDIPNETGQSYTVTQSGWYSVFVTDSNGCQAESGWFWVTALANPVPAVNGPAAGCLSGVTISTGTYPSYQWRRAGVDITGATSSSLLVIQSGIYTVHVIDTNWCSGTSADFSVTIYPDPEPSPVIIGQNAACAQPGGVFGTGAFSTYQWSRDGVLIPGATLQTYTAAASGSYKVTVADSSGCTGTSQPWLFTAWTAPAPVVSGSTFNTCPSTVVPLSIGAFSSYQWYMNGAALSGATTSEHNAEVSGTYWVEVTDAHGCTGVSNQHTVFIDFCPMTEVSPTGALFPLKIVKSSLSSTGYYIYFQRVDTVDGFNIYEGNTGSWYSHGGSPGNACNALVEDLCTGEMRAELSPSSGIQYYLVTAHGGGVEGPSGYQSRNEQIPEAQSSCAP